MVLAGLTFGSSGAAWAGPICEFNDPLPPGSLTLGVKSSSDLTGGYLDSITPFWAPGSALFALNTRSTYDNRDQSLNSYGLIARYRVPNQDFIFGVNGYYDAVHSQQGNDFDQAGFGAEMLSRWVDVRFNYYLPEDTRYEIGRTTSVKTKTTFGPVVSDGMPTQATRPAGRNGIAGASRLFTQSTVTLTQTRTKTETKRTVKRYEAALQGWNTEAGLLIPGLDEYMEVRVFAGAYGYQNPFGKDRIGFKGRLEARVLPAITADVEYWEDASLMGGHWTGECRVTVPFSLFKLASGRNPFEGAGDQFKFRKRNFQERMGEMVMRSHREFSSSGVPGEGDQPPPVTSSKTSGPIKVGEREVLTPVKVESVPIGFPL
jgi:hypothetical protein